MSAESKGGVKVRSNIGRLLIVVVAAGLAGACATAQPQYTPGSIDPEYWVAKVDQFALVGDGSLSMSDRFEKMRKLDIAQAVLDSMNQTIPNFDHDGAFRAFGRGACGTAGKILLVVPLGSTRRVPSTEPSTTSPARTGTALSTRRWTAQC
jgi:hypothetical protein